MFVKSQISRSKHSADFGLKAASAIAVGGLALFAEFGFRGIVALLALLHTLH